MEGLSLIFTSAKTNKEQATGYDSTIFSHAWGIFTCLGPDSITVQGVPTPSPCVWKQVIARGQDTGNDNNSAHHCTPEPLSDGLVASIASEARCTCHSMNLSSWFGVSKIGSRDNHIRAVFFETK